MAPLATKKLCRRRRVTGWGSTTSTGPASRAGGSWIGAADPGTGAATVSMVKMIAVPRPGGHLLLMCKPQFEAQPGDVGKGGVVRDPEVRRRAVASVARYASDLGGVHPIA